MTLWDVFCNGAFVGHTWAYSEAHAIAWFREDESTGWVAYESEGAEDQGE